jgi:flagellar basal-body rod protein FlgB
MQNWSYSDSENNLREERVITALSSITKDLALLALDGFSMRHQAIASNIANRDTAGYQRLKVSFEDQLAAITQAHDSGASDDELRALLGHASAQLKIMQTGDMEVRLDSEMGDLTRNTLQYQALITALGRMGSITRAAVSGGQS